MDDLYMGCVDIELLLLDLCSEIRKEGVGNKQMDILIGHLMDAQMRVEKTVKDNDIGKIKMSDLKGSHRGIGYTTDPNAC